MDIPQNTQGREATAWLSSDTGIGSRNLNISLGLRDLDVKRRNPDSKQSNRAHRCFVTGPAYGVHSTGSRRKNSVPTPHEYLARLEKFVGAVAAKQHQHILIGNTKASVVVAGLLLLWMTFDK